MADPEHRGKDDEGEARRRVIVLTQWFDPEPTPRGLEFARLLDANGFDVEVVTGFPNYPGGRVYPGHRIRPLLRTREGPISITRLALYPSHGRSRVGRVANYLSFFFSSFLYLTFVARRSDVIYVYHPPITVDLAAVLSQFLRRTPIVLDVQDMWPDTLQATGMIGSGRVLRLIGALARFVYRHCTHIVAQSPGFRRLLLERGVEAEKVSVVYNWTNAQTRDADGSTRPAAMPADGTFRVLFAGNMGPAQALGRVLDAAALLRERHPGIAFVFLGSGLDAGALEERARAEGLTNVRFLPRVALHEVGSYLQAADALLVHLKDDPLFRITIPSKIQTYMAAGRPIIVAVRGDGADLVTSADCGSVVAPEDPQALADAVVALATSTPEARVAMGRRAADYYEHHLSAVVGGNRFAQVLRAVSKKD